MSSIKLKHSGGNSVSLNPPTSAPTSSDVAFKLPNADGSAGQYMKTDGSGNLAFATISTPVAGITVWDTWHFGSYYLKLRRRFNRFSLWIRHWSSKTFCIIKWNSLGFYRNWNDRIWWNLYISTNRYVGNCS